MPRHDRVLVDFRTSDDAGVYRLDDGRALVQTVDFFTPIVDDPFTYGQIAAANALSDVYAMGGRPLTALAIAGFPRELDREVITTIFAGGLDVLERAGVALLGGHTVQDQEVKFGYAVTGEVSPSRIWSNAGARPGDVLILTKPLGTGIVATALKAGRAPQQALDEAVRWMLTLNRAACEVLTGFAPAVHACTDVTGFGLIGHASEMAAASGVTVEIETGGVPLLEGVQGLTPGNVPGGGRNNAAYFPAALRSAAPIDADVLTLLHDPQTSGGLLVALDPERASEVEGALRGSQVAVWRVGRVIASAGHAVMLR